MPQVLLNKRDIDSLASELNLSPDQFTDCLQNADSLARFKVPELKRIIQYVKGKVRVSLTVSGTKKDLVGRLSQVLFQADRSKADRPRSDPSTLSSHLLAPPTLFDRGTGPGPEIPPSPFNPLLASSALQPAPSSLQWQSRLVLPGSNVAQSSSLSNPSLNLSSSTASTAIGVRKTKWTALDLASSDKFLSRQDPFFEQIRLIAAVPLGESNISNCSERQTFQVDGQTHRQLITDIERRRNGTAGGIAVQARLFTSKMNDIGWQHDMRPRINKRFVEAPHMRKVRTASKDPFVTFPPLDISPHVVSGNNAFEMERPSYFQGALVFQLVRILTPQQLLAKVSIAPAPAPPPSEPKVKKQDTRLPSPNPFDDSVSMSMIDNLISDDDFMSNNPPPDASLLALLDSALSAPSSGSPWSQLQPMSPDFDMFTTTSENCNSLPEIILPDAPHHPQPQKDDKEEDSEDDEVQEVDSVMSLRCPLSYKRMEVPAKGTNCRHRQCFDLKAFLEFSHQQHVWQCPVCQVPLPFTKLVIDDFTSRVLQVLSPDEVTVIVKPDGKFEVPSTLKSSNSTTNNSSASPRPHSPLRSSKRKGSPSSGDSSRRNPAEPEVIELSDSDDEDRARAQAFVSIKQEKQAEEPLPFPSFWPPMQSLDSMQQTLPSCSASTPSNPAFHCSPQVSFPSFSHPMPLRPTAESYPGSHTAASRPFRAPWELMDSSLATTHDSNDRSHMPRSHVSLFPPVLSSNHNTLSNIQQQSLGGGTSQTSAGFVVSPSTQWIPSHTHRSPSHQPQSSTFEVSQSTPWIYSNNPQQQQHQVSNPSGAAFDLPPSNLWQSSNAQSQSYQSHLAAGNNNNTSSSFRMLDPSAATTLSRMMERTWSGSNLRNNLMLNSNPSYPQQTVNMSGLTSNPNASYMQYHNDQSHLPQSSYNVNPNASYIQESDGTCEYMSNPNVSYAQETDDAGDYTANPNASYAQENDGTFDYTSNPNASSYVQDTDMRNYLQNNPISYLQQPNRSNTSSSLNPSYLQQTANTHLPSSSSSYSVQQAAPGRQANVSPVEVIELDDDDDDD
mmetsp:Transcript_27178/g.44317  ORF Transcript_27178/g.44317 Transcript_27178/m.44317 type:complete len:1062 (+) Transcript_27178:111-3296(+)